MKEQIGLLFYNVCWEVENAHSYLKIAYNRRVNTNRLFKLLIDKNH